MKEIVITYCDNEAYDYSCSEKMLYAANEKYNLGLDEKHFYMMASFSGGMMVENTCGAIAGSIAVLGIMFTEGVAHTSEKLRELVPEFIERFNSRLGYVDCLTLKENYRTEEEGCKKIVIDAAEILEEMIDREIAETL